MENNDLLSLKNKFLDDINDENTVNFLNCLINSNVFIVADVVIPDHIKKKLDEFDKEEISFETKELSFNPLLLDDEENNEKLLPIFSNEEEIIEEELKSHGLLSLPFSEIINIYKNEESITSIVLDPFTRGYKFLKEDILNLEKDINNSIKKD